MTLPITILSDKVEKTLLGLTGGAGRGIILRFVRMALVLDGGNIEMTSRFGMVALVGRPNVGKSTLMNYLVGEKISITTPVAQTTRNQIRGIQNHPDGQIVYLDTPGIHKARNPLNQTMVNVAWQAIDEVDLVLYLVDATRPDPQIAAHLPSEIGTPHRDDSRKDPGFGEDAMILQRFKETQTPVYLVINKVDQIVPKSLLLPLIQRYTEGSNFREVIPISASTGENTDQLVRLILQVLPEGVPLFPPEYATDRAERFLVSELIREQLILLTRQELPHSCAVLVEAFDEERRDEQDRPLVRIEATIIVERDSQKGIVIGKRGEMLKQVGQRAREEIENLLGCHVFLKLWVRVDKNWSRDMSSVRRLGYGGELEQ